MLRRTPLVASSLLLLAGAGAAGAETPLAAARLVEDIRTAPRLPVESFAQWLTAGADRLYFAADDGFAGVELWGSDGTPSGTALLADLLPPPERGAELRPLPLGRAGGFLLVATPGGSLWRTRGAPGDLELLRDGLGRVQVAAAAGGGVYFLSTVGEGEEWVLSLWRSDAPRRTSTASGPRCRWRRRGSAALVGPGRRTRP